MTNTRLERLIEFQEKIGFKIDSIELLEMALTHSSYANESKGKFQHNERMEFLGDSILSLIVSDYLFTTYPDVSEGNLTKKRAVVVSERSLVSMAEEISLGSYILLGRGEESTGGRQRASILADAFESLIAAVYLNGGLDVARSFVLKYITKAIEMSFNGQGFRDYKTELQEKLQRRSDSEIEYRIVSEQGPDHDKVFVAEVNFDGNSIGSGTGKSKKEAEQQAASNAMNTLV